MKPTSDPYGTFLKHINTFFGAEIFDSDICARHSSSLYLVKWANSYANILCYKVLSLKGNLMTYASGKVYFILFFIICIREMLIFMH